MITIKITEEMHRRAEERSQNIPPYKLSYRGGAEANAIGCLGEHIIEDWLNKNNIPFQDERNETTHDYRFGDGKTFDVKTKDRTVPMRSSYDCTTSDYNAEHQKPYYYLFVSLQRDDPIKNLKNIKNIELHNNNDIRRFHTAFIIGGVKRRYFNKHSIGWKKGQIDPSNNWPVRFDCHNLHANQIVPPNEVIKKLKSLNLM